MSPTLDNKRKDLRDLREHVLARLGEAALAVKSFEKYLVAHEEIGDVEMAEFTQGRLDTAKQCRDVLLDIAYMVDWASDEEPKIG